MMMMEWKTHIHRLWFINKTTFFYYYCCIISSIFFLSTACSFLGTAICIKTTTFSGGMSFPLAGKVDFYYVQEFEMVLEKMNGQEILASSKGDKREVFAWARIIPAAVHVKVWHVYAVQAGACGSAATRDAGDCRVLPRSLEVQMWQQIVQALALVFAIYQYFT